MKQLLAVVLMSLGPWLVTASAGPRPVKVKGPWCALHLPNFQNDADLQRIEAELPALAARGVSILVLEVDYGFEFRSHPELHHPRVPALRPSVVGEADLHASHPLPGAGLDTGGLPARTRASTAGSGTR